MMKNRLLADDIEYLVIETDEDEARPIVTIRDDADEPVRFHGNYRVRLKEKRSPER